MRSRALNILTKGIISPASAFTKGYITYKSIRIVPDIIFVQNSKPRGRIFGGNEYVDHEAFLRKVFSPVEASKPIASVEAIAEMIASIDTREGEVIHIVLEYKPKDKSNIVVECKQLKSDIMVKLLETGKSVNVDLIYNP